MAKSKSSDVLRAHATCPTDLLDGSASKRLTRYTNPIADSSCDCQQGACPVLPPMESAGAEGQSLTENPLPKDKVAKGAKPNAKAPAKGAKGSRGKAAPATVDNPLPVTPEIDASKGLVLATNLGAFASYHTLVVDYLREQIGLGLVPSKALRDLTEDDVRHAYVRDTPPIMLAKKIAESYAHHRKG